jgi:DNA-binding transcriptional MerR regulator
MRIGELAQRARVTVRTVRYYIEEGLLPMPPMRGKYGDFDESYLQRLRLVRNLKDERLSLSAIRERLEEMGLTEEAGSPQLPLPNPLGQERAVRAPLPTLEMKREGLFRSRFAEEAGLTPEQIARLEGMGLLESSEGLLPPEALPLARAAGRLLAAGATMEDIAELARQVHEETALHRRLMQKATSQAPLARALQWQEQVGAAAAIRQILLQRWGYSSAERP